MSIKTVPLVAALFLFSTSLHAQDHRVMLGLGAGTLNPDDPFQTTLSFRGSAAWILNHRHAFTFTYTRQSANRSTNEDLGRYARQLIGVSWQYAFQEAFWDEEHLKQQYFLSLGTGIMTRGPTRDVDPVQDLSDAPFFHVGLSIRYPIVNALAVLGSIEDDFALLPQQTLNTRCNATTCFPEGSGQYYTFEVPGDKQHNFGLFILLQWRP